MSDHISVNVQSVRELFSGVYKFHLPWFQRAYAWQTAEVGRLLSNILEAMATTSGPRRYFLGKIMLAKHDGSPQTSLVDGHQRVMTLTLLYSVLRDLHAEGSDREGLHKFVSHNGHHLLPQHLLAEFTDRFVQAPGATLEDPDDDLGALSDTQRNIIENRNYLRVELGTRDIDAATRTALASFLADSCFVMTCAVDDENEAWRILQIEEDTRVDFNPADRAKASLLSILPNGERTQCQRHWEHCEALLGSADLHALLLHLRTHRLRRLSDKPVETDLAVAFALNSTGLPFLANEVVPAAQHLADIRAGTIGSGSARTAIAAYIRQMSWIDANFWVPAALNWLSLRGDQDPETVTFFRLLERLVWMIRLSGLDPVKRQRHVLRLLGEMDKGANPDKLRELEISRAMRDAALDNLRSHTFDAKHYATRVLRRASTAMGRDPGPVHATRVTLEHILPRSFNATGPWQQAFPTRKAVQSHAHRLGNLTFLTGADNQAADTLDWAAKRRILSASDFVLSQRAGTSRQWTSEQILARTEELIAILMKDWQIKL